VNIKNHKPLRKHLTLIRENAKQAKGYFEQGKISKEDLDALMNADPTKQKKYVGWMTKIFLKDRPDIDDLRNKIEEFDTLLNKGRINTKDINQFKSFNDLKKEVDDINNSGAGITDRDLENDYETILDNSDLLVMCPHTHEASRKLGLSKFAFRDCEGGGKDSAWCTTYKAPDHFNDYYYNRNVTFYYIRVKSNRLIEKLKDQFPNRYKKLEVVALAILPDENIDAYDGLDKQLTSSDINKFLKTINIK